MIKWSQDIDRYIINSYLIIIKEIYLNHYIIKNNMDQLSYYIMYLK